MEERKNNKGLIWLVVILIILVLGLVGYIVYDKVLSTDKDLINEKSTSTTTTTTTTIKIEDNELNSDIGGNIINKLEIEIDYNSGVQIKDIDLKIKVNDIYNSNYNYEGFNIYKYDDSLESVCDMSSYRALSKDFILNDEEKYIIEIDELKIKDMKYSESMWVSGGTVYINGNPLEQFENYCGGSKYETNDSHSLRFIFSKN